MYICSVYSYMFPISFYIFPTSFPYSFPMFLGSSSYFMIFPWFFHGFPLQKLPILSAQGDDDLDRGRLRIALQLRRGDRPAACGLERWTYGNDRFNGLV